MYKIYIVGLGGSGGKTLQFLMDQLSTELRDRGWEQDRLPRCWQFLQVDVPPQPDGVGEGLPPTVRDQKGTYIPITTPQDKYQQLDAGLEQALSQPSVNQLRQLVGWRPDPSKVITPIVRGAGQYRAVGRLATLARARQIYDGLRVTAQDLNSGQANQDFTELRRLLGHRPGASQGTMVLVVSSLAGGTGASMTLDVCNLLRGVQHELPDFPGGDAIAYLYTPDVFGKLDEAARSGVNANALGTIAELMSARAAAQKEWTAEEWSVYGVGQAPLTPGRGPRAVFPVGATNGISGALFGDGRSVTIFRGFSRALTSLFLSEAQQTQINSYVVANFGNTEALPDSSGLAWAPGGGQDPLGFGAIGFASIGLGRDRYAEYVSQRLARLAVTGMLRGHHDASVSQGQRTQIEARDQYAADGYPWFQQWARLPVSPPINGGPLQAWIEDIWAANRRSELLSQAVGRLVSEVAPPGMKQRTGWFAGQLAALVPRCFQSVAQSSEDATRAAAQLWVGDIQARIEVATLRAVGRWGLPVTRRIVERFELDLKGWASLLRTSSTATGTGHDVASEVVAPFYATDGQIDSQHMLMVQAQHELTGKLDRLALCRAAAVAADLVEGLAVDVVRPLQAALADTSAGLTAAEDSRLVDAAVSSVRTPIVQAWPEGDQVPTRFATATNEVLLEDVDSYPSRFRAHVGDSFSTAVMGSGLRPSADESLALAVEQVVTFLDIDPTGRRPVSGVEQLVAFGEDGRTPVKVGRRSSWWPRLLAGSAPAQAAWYEPLWSADALLAGARAWVARPGHPLYAFTRQGLRSYLTNLGAHGQHERDRLETGFAGRFRSALQFAAPLVGVHPGMVTAVHGQPVKVSYQFSAAPINGAPSALRQITQGIEADTAIDTRPTLEALDTALASEDANVDLPRIDIIGTYAQSYSPLVFTSLLGPIQQQWAQAISVQQRTAFWRWRRGRRLQDFVPVSPAWFQAFITGWLVGRFTGQLSTPKGGDLDQRIKVFDDGRWAAFPDSLLGVHQINRDLVGWGIPAAVAESLALAIAQCNADPTLAALRPYIATRRLGEELPLPGSIRHPAIHAWIVEGRSISGTRPQVARADAAVGTVQERLDHARDWLTKLRASVVTKMLPHGVHGAPGTGPFSEINRHNFAQVPREWEIAEQLVIGVEQILAELNRPDYRVDGSAVVEVGIDDVDA